MTGSEISTKDVFDNLRAKRLEGGIACETCKRKKPVVFDVVRNDIPVNSVDCSYMVNDSTGYLRVTKFARNTYNEFFTALNDLKAQGAR